ncbi:hypothetical protein C0J52_19869 [Blattella germanica]|nr:hypothetical protein C0J52_19869 [Blattella germanica]
MLVIGGDSLEQKQNRKLTSQENKQNRDSTESDDFCVGSLLEPSSLSEATLTLTYGNNMISGLNLTHAKLTNNIRIEYTECPKI